MRKATFNGPQDALRLRGGRVLRRGVPTEVTNDEANRLDGRRDVTVHRSQSQPDDD